MSKRHQAKQDVCLLTETNSVGDESLESSITHAESPDTLEAWGLDSNQQAKDEKTGRYVQFISAVSCDPVKIYRNLALKITPIAAISAQTEDQEMVYIEEGRKKDGRLLWVGICLALLTLTVCVVVLMRMKGF